MPKLVDHAKRREEISRIAADLIAAGGMEAVTIRSIAMASAYSKGVVEHYFENKAELVSGALAWVNQCYEARVQKATAGLSGLIALRKRIEASLPLDKRTRDEWKVRLVFWGMAAIDPQLRREQARRFQQAVDYFEQDLQVAAGKGEIPVAKQTANTARRLVNMTTGISTAAIHNGALYDRTFLLEEAHYMLSVLTAGEWRGD